MFYDNQPENQQNAYKRMLEILGMLSRLYSSNPNKDLGHWLLRDVLEVPEGTLITYDMLELFGIDSVIFTKLEEGRYSVDFCQLGTYARVYNTKDEDDDL